MKPLFMVLIAALATGPVFAQHEEHSSPAPEPQATPDPHAGHTMVTTPAEPAAVHDMNAMGTATPEQPEAPPPPAAFSGPTHAADTLFAAADMARARETVRSEHGDLRSWLLMADQLESHLRDKADAYVWNMQGWYGSDINKLWIKSAGDGDAGESPEHAELQALWSHAIAPWWDFQAGVRHDFRPDAGRTHLVVGLQGLLPYKFGIDAAAFFSEDGDVSARLEAEYDQQITQRLILQPRIEVELAAQDIPASGIGSGITNADLGLRLRFEFAREFAPYLGVEYGRSFGGTADYARAAGKEVGGWSLLVGVRTWF